MNTIGIQNSQGNTTLRSIPHQIRVVRNTAHGGAKPTMVETILDLYTGPQYQTEHGTIHSGDYITFGFHLTAEWVARHPGEWERIG